MANALTSCLTLTQQSISRETQRSVFTKQQGNGIMNGEESGRAECVRVDRMGQV